VSPTSATKASAVPASRLAGMFIGSKILITRATIGRRSTHVQARVTTSTCRAPVVTHSSSSLVPPAGGVLALRPIFVSLDREDPGSDAVARAPTASRSSEAPESTSARVHPSKCTLENLRDYRTRFHRDKRPALMRRPRGSLVESSRGRSSRNEENSNDRVITEDPPRADSSSGSVFVSRPMLPMSMAMYFE